MAVVDEVDVYLKEGETGHLMLVDGSGRSIGRQRSTVISQEVGDLTHVKVEFILNPSSLMFKGGGND